MQAFRGQVKNFYTHTVKALTHPVFTSTVKSLTPQGQVSILHLDSCAHHATFPSTIYSRYMF